MKAKSFYIEKSIHLHAQREAAVALVRAIENDIDENIRLINVAPDIADDEPVPPPVAKLPEEPMAQPIKPAGKAASKKV